MFNNYNKLTQIIDDDFNTRKNAYVESKATTYFDYINSSYDKYNSEIKTEIDNFERSYENDELFIHTFDKKEFKKPRYIVSDNKCSQLIDGSKCNKEIDCHISKTHNIKSISDTDRTINITMRYYKCKDKHINIYRYDKYENIICEEGDLPKKTGPYSDKDILCEDGTFLPKYTINAKIINALVFFKSLERMLFFYTNPNDATIYVSKFSKNELIKKDQKYDKYNEIMIYNTPVKKSYCIKYSYKNINEYFNDVLNTEKENDPEYQKPEQKTEQKIERKTERKTERKNKNIRKFNNKYIDEVYKNISDDLNTCISVEGGDYSTAYACDNTTKYKMEENIQILKKYTKNIHDFFEREINLTNKEPEQKLDIQINKKHLERKIYLPDIQQKLIDEMTRPLTDYELNQITTERKEKIEILSNNSQEQKTKEDSNLEEIKRPLIVLEQKTKDDKTKDDKTNNDEKKMMETVYGLTDTDFKNIKDNYDFELEDKNPNSKPLFFSHSDYNLNNTEKYYPSERFIKGDYSSSYNPDMKIFKKDNKENFEVQVYKTKLSAKRQLVLSTGETLLKIGLIKYDYVHYRNDNLYIIIPAYSNIEKIPKVLQWSHKLNNYFVQKLYKKPLIFSIIYYEPAEHEMYKYFFLDMSEKKLIGCILIRVKYNRDMLLYVFAEHKKHGWIQQHNYNLEKITHIVNFRSNKVDLDDSIFDAIKITYKELAILHRMKKTGSNMHIYRVGDTSQYLFSEKTKEQIIKFYNNNNLNIEEINILVEVEFFEDEMYFNFLRFKPIETKNGKSKVDEITIEDNIKIIKQLFTSDILQKITTYMRKELNSLYLFVIKYSELNNKNIEKCLASFFSLDVEINDIDTGSIGMPLFGSRENEIKYLIKDGNIREVLSSIATFIKNRGFLKDDDNIRGCEMLWDLYINTDKYIDTLNILNINGINARKEELRILIGYDFKLIEDNIKKYGEMLDWCNIALPFKIISRYSLTSPSTIHKGDFSADMNPVIPKSYIEQDFCKKNTINKPFIPYSNKEKIQMTRIQNPYVTGECFHKPNNIKTINKWSKLDINDQKENILRDGKVSPIKVSPFETNMRNKYNHPNIANMSGHVLLIYDLLALFIPSETKTFDIYNALKKLSILSLANIVWLVPPHHHSIHEVLQASHLTKIYYEKTSIPNDVDGYIRGEYDATEDITNSINQLIKNIT